MTLHFKGWENNLIGGGGVTRAKLCTKRAWVVQGRWKLEKNTYALVGNNVTEGVVKVVCDRVKKELLRQLPNGFVTKLGGTLLVV